MRVVYPDKHNNVSIRKLRAFLCVGTRKPVDT